MEPRPDAVVVATQGAGDARGLGAAIESGAAYVGFISSPKKGARLKDSLKKRGHDAEAVEAIDAPAGLDIGARSPEEVGLSVLAEIIQRRAAASASSTESDDERTEAG
jgi:xanthine dehydrogenase accessory factor